MHMPGFINRGKYQPDYNKSTNPLVLAHRVLILWHYFFLPSFLKESRKVPVLQNLMYRRI